MQLRINVRNQIDIMEILLELLSLAEKCQASEKGRKQPPIT